MDVVAQGVLPSARHSTAGIQLQRASRRRLTLFSRYQGIYKFKKKTELNQNFQIVTLLYLICKNLPMLWHSICFFPLN